MSTNRNYIVSAIDDNIRKMNRTGTEIWNRRPASPFQAVAVSGDGSLVIATDNRGLTRSWTIDSKNLGVNNDTDQVKPNRFQFLPPDLWWLFLPKIS